MNIFNNLCRSCNINKDKLLSIHDVQESSIFIKNMLEYCLQTTITDDSKYPKVICYDCLHQLEISYRFIKRFHLSQNEFDESYRCLQKIIGDTTDDCLGEDGVVDTLCYDGLKNNSMNAFQNVSDYKNISLGIHEPPKCDKSLMRSDSKCLAVVDVPAESEKTPVICLVCNKTFFTQKALNLHLKLSHKQKS